MNLAERVPHETPKARPASGWTIQMLVGELEARGTSDAVIDVGPQGLKRISCGELAATIAALAHGLIASGIGPGTTVGLIAPNGPDWVTARLALGSTGALVHALDDLYSDGELRIALEEARCSLILTSPGHVAQLAVIDPSCRLFVLADEPVGCAPSWRNLFRPSPEPLPAIDPDAPAMLVYTSGTTGKPKAFLLTSSQLWANVSAIKASGLVSGKDRSLLPLPLHHVYPFCVGVLTVLSCGGTIVFPEEVGGPQILRALDAAQVTVILGVPRLYSALVAGLQAKLKAAGGVGAALFRILMDVSIWAKKTLGINAGWWLMAPVRKKLGPKLRILGCGGAPLQPEVLWPLIGLGFDVRTGYGLAETASIFTGNLPGKTRLGSEGKPFCGELRIAPAADAPEGEGEIQLRGPTVFSGYRNNETANREAFTEDGFFRTGDIGHLDKDGFLFVTGRIKEMLILGGGKKVLPEELEKHYASSYFKEIAVLERDGVLVALVLPDLDAIRQSGYPRIDDIVRITLSERAMALPSYERLSGFRIMREPLPKTRLQKYQRFRLRALYDAAETKRAAADAPLTDEDKVLLGSEPARSVFEILKARYQGKPVSLDASPLLDLGIDSLEWVTLALILEQQAGVRLDESEAGESQTVRDILRHAAKERPVHSDYSAAIARWLKPSGPFLVFAAKRMLALNALLMRLLFRLKIDGREHLPERAPFLIVPNHESDLDPLLVAALLPGLDLHWAGDAARLFGRRSLHPLMRALGMFPADDKRAGETLALAAEVLKRGGILVWFPESWRSPDGALQRFLPGVGRLLGEAPVPVVPAFIEGAFEAMPRMRHFPLFGRAITISFGVPLTGLSGTPQEIADRLHEAVAALAK